MCNKCKPISRILFFLLIANTRGNKNWQETIFLVIELISKNELKKKDIKPCSSHNLPLHLLYLISKGYCAKFNVKVFTDRPDQVGGLVRGQVTGPLIPKINTRCQINLSKSCTRGPMESNARINTLISFKSHEIFAVILALSRAQA